MDYREITGNVLLFGGVAIFLWMLFGYHIKRLPYKARYVRNKIWRAFGYCPKCGAKMNRTGAGRLICTVDSCK